MSSQNSTGNHPEILTEEQAICVTCGMCCDGTLFQHAHLNPGERGHLPEKIEKASYTSEGKDYFSLPCGYFMFKCSIYYREKAYVCSAYRCQLLRDFSEGKITRDEAFETVKDARSMLVEIMNLYHKASGNNQEIFFKKLLREIGKIHEKASENSPVSPEYDLLLYKCNILEALLIKHFRSAEDFGKMIMK